MARPVSVITGASSGIGMVFARRLATEYDLLLVARRRDRMEALADELRARHGGVVEVLAADLSDERDLRRVAERVAGVAELGLLVNNAGFGTKGRFWEADLEGQEKMHRLHVMATVTLSHAALGVMVPRGQGGVVNVASVAAFVHRPGSASYGATKSWMVAFTEGLYLDLKTIGSAVKVQALCPGFTYSEFHDVMQLGRGTIAGPALWLKAEDVVEASLDGLRRGRLLVVPGWRYQWIVGLVTKLPERVRVYLQGRRPKVRA